MKFARIVIEKSDEAGGFHVLIDGEWMADGLSSDECLGSVASAIYGPDSPAQFTTNVPVLTQHGADLLHREGRHSRCSM